MLSLQGDFIIYDYNDIVWYARIECYAQIYDDSFGHVLDTIGTCAGHVRGMFGPCLGHVRKCHGIWGACI